MRVNEDFNIACLQLPPTSACPPLVMFSAAPGAADRMPLHRLDVHLQSSGHYPVELQCSPFVGPWTASPFVKAALVPCCLTHLEFSGGRVMSTGLALGHIDFDRTKTSRAASLACWAERGSRQYCQRCHDRLSRWIVELQEDLGLDLGLSWEEGIGSSVLDRASPRSLLLHSLRPRRQALKLTTRCRPSCVGVFVGAGVVFVVEVCFEVRRW